MSHTSISDRLIPASDLKTNQGRGLDAVSVLTLIDFYLIRSPRSSKSVKRSSVQTIDLSEYGLTGSRITKLIDEILFDQPMEFCLNQNRFASEARKRGFYLDDRIKDHKSGAYLQQDSCSQITKIGIETLKAKESKDNCFFRHLRNSFAHGSIYRVGHGKVLFVDRALGNNGSVTAYIITTALRLDKLRAELLRNWSETS